MRVPLIIIGTFSLTRFIAYGGPLSPKQTPYQLAFIDETIPLWGYALIWGIAGVVALLSGWLPQLRPTAVGLNVAMNSLWGLVYFAAFLWLDSPRSWITSTTYLCIAAGVVWVGTLSRKLPS